MSPVLKDPKDAPKARGAAALDKAVLLCYFFTWGVGTGDCIQGFFQGSIHFWNLCRPQKPSGSFQESGTLIQTGNYYQDPHMNLRAKRAGQVNDADMVRGALSIARDLSRSKLWALILLLTKPKTPPEHRDPSQV